MNIVQLGRPHDKVEVLEVQAHVAHLPVELVQLAQRVGAHVVGPEVPGAEPGRRAVEAGRLPGEKTGRGSRVQG